MILITGATGRVGSHLLRALIEKNEEIRILVRGEKPVRVPENVEIAYGDITDKDAVRKAMYHCDTIYHLAAVVDYLAPKDLMYRVNVLGTKNVATFGRDRKVIYLSSTAVYGYKPKEIPITEKTPCKPSNLYGKTKYLAEKYILEIGGIIVRSPIAFGRNFTFTNGYNEIFSLLQSNKLPLIGNGNNFIHWIYIDDLIRALLLAMDNGKPGEVYLIAGKEIKMLKELLEITCRHLNAPMPTKKVSKILASLAAQYKMLTSKFSGERPKLIPAYIDKIASNRTYDITKAEKELGFKPEVGYETGIKEMIEEFLKNQQDNVAIK